MNKYDVFVESISRLGLQENTVAAMRGLFEACFPNVLTEATMAQLAAPVDELRKLRSKSLTFHFTDLTMSKDGQAVVHFIVPSQTKGGSVNYDVYIEFIPPKGTLFSMAQGTMRPAQKIALLKSCNVKVFCTCQDLNWHGMKYNLKHVYDSYLEGYESSEGIPPGGEDIAPNVRDPHRHNRVCKHLIAAFKAVLTNWTSIIKAAKTYHVPPSKAHAISEESVPEPGMEP